MNIRNRPAIKFPVKNQITSIEFRGKAFAVCDAQQLLYMLDMEREKIIREYAESQREVEKFVPMNEEEIKQKLEDFKNTCGFATLDTILSWMTPAERQDWEMKYRFTPFTRSRK